MCKGIEMRSKYIFLLVTNRHAVFPQFLTFNTVFHLLFSQIRSQLEITRVIIIHKLGTCPIGEISVLIAVSSAHRSESLKAVDFAINELKRTVPIWKKVAVYVLFGLKSLFCRVSPIIP